MRLPEQDQCIADDVLRQARTDAETYSIPKYVYQAWRSQRNNALARGIEFRFTLLRWHLWWLGALHGKGPAAKRGRRRGEYQMCRIGDAGAYETGNVYCGTSAENQNEPALRRTRTATMIARHAASPCYLVGRTGDSHPKSKAVMLPDGTRYGSIALASAAAGITRAGGHYRVKRGVWVYA